MAIRVVLLLPIVDVILNTQNTKLGVLNFIGRLTDMCRSCIGQLPSFVSTI